MLQGARVTGLSLQRGAPMGQGELRLLQPLEPPGWEHWARAGPPQPRRCASGVWGLGFALPAAPVDVCSLGTRL